MNRITEKKYRLILIVLLISGVLFVITDAVKNALETSLMEELQKQFAGLGANNDGVNTLLTQTRQSGLAQKNKAEIRKLKTYKLVAGIARFVFLLVAAIAWFYAPLKYKFLALSIFFIYYARVHFIDYENLVLLCAYNEKVRAFKKITVAFFPAFLFFLLYLGCILRK